MNTIDIKKVIEAIIFVSDKPVTLHRLQLVFPHLSHQEIGEILIELSNEWENLNRGFKLIQVSDGYHFRTLPECSEYILKFREQKPFKLSKAAMEVLAIVAYKQPITRLEIDQIRGVDSSGVVGVLLEKRLIQIKGRKEIIGKPFLYATDNEFLETFGLKSLTDLPTLKEIDEIEKTLELQNLQVGD